MLFVPCIVDGTFTILNQKNSLCSSLDIHIISKHSVYLHVSIHNGSSSWKSIK